MASSGRQSGGPRVTLPEDPSVSGLLSATAKSWSSATYHGVSGYIAWDIPCSRVRFIILGFVYNYTCNYTRFFDSYKLMILFLLCGGCVARDRYLSDFAVGRLVLSQQAGSLRSRPADGKSLERKCQRFDNLLRKFHVRTCRCYNPWCAF